MKHCKKIVLIITCTTALTIESGNGSTNKSWWQRIREIARMYSNPEVSGPGLPSISPAASSIKTVLQQFQNAVKTEYRTDGAKKKQLLQKIRIMHFEKPDDTNRETLVGLAIVNLVKDDIFKKTKSEDVYYLKQILNLPDQKENVGTYLYDPLYKEFTEYDSEFSAKINDIFSMTSADLAKQIALDHFNTYFASKNDSKQWLSYAVFLRTVRMTRRSVSDIKTGIIIPKGAYAKIDAFVDNAIKPLISSDNPSKLILKNELKKLIEQDIKNRFLLKAQQSKQKNGAEEIAPSAIQKQPKNELPNELKPVVFDYFEKNYASGKTRAYNNIIPATIKFPNTYSANVNSFIDSLVPAFIAQFPVYKAYETQTKSEFRKLFDQDIENKIKTYRAQ